jgi:hypothetical protein
MDLLARLRETGIVDEPANRRMVIEIERIGGPDTGKKMAQVSTVRRVDPARSKGYDEIEVLRRVDDPYLARE